MPGYIEDEKLAIARQYLLKKQKEANGIGDIDVEINDEALRGLIRYYTLEAGVRQLERNLGKVVRKLAVRVASGATGPFNVSPADVAAIARRLGGALAGPPALEPGPALQAALDLVEEAHLPSFRCAGLLCAGRCHLRTGCPRASVAWYPPRMCHPGSATLGPRAGMPRRRVERTRIGPVWHRTCKEAAMAKTKDKGKKSAKAKTLDKTAKSAKAKAEKKGKEAAATNWTQTLRVAPGFSLLDLDAESTPGFAGDKAAGQLALEGIDEQLSELQELSLIHI